MGYMFRLLFESSSGPQGIDPDIQTFTALRDPQLLQNRMYTYVHTQGTAVAQWSRRCATNRNVAGSIPAGVIGTFC